MNPQRLRLFGVGLTATACVFGLWHAEQLAAEVKLFGKKAGKPAAATASNPSLEQPIQPADVQNVKSSQRSVAVPTDKTIKINYFSRSWDDVLNDIAKQSGRQLIIDKVPPGRFSRNEWSRYSLAEALRILNRELEPKGFRLLERGQYLDLVFLRDARSEYSRPVVGNAEFAGQDMATNSGVEDNSLPEKSTATVAKKDTARKPDRWKPSTSTTNRSRRDGLIQQAAFEEPADENDEEELELPEVTRRWIEVPLKRQTARNVSRLLFQAFEQDAELIDQGPNGLPGFVVWKDLPVTGRGPAKSQPAVPKRIARFAVGADTKGERLVIDGPQSEVAAIKTLISKLDVVSNTADRTTRLVSTKRDAKQVAQTLNSAVKQLTQARAAEQSDDAELAQAETPAKPKAKKKAKKPTESKPTNPADPNQPKEGGEMEAPADQSKAPSISGPLKGDVSVEELGDVLVIRGNEQDVQMVEKLIEEIGRMLSGSVPDVNVRPLKHVDSESLAELLTTVYERLNRSRGRSANDQTQQIVVIAIGKPNSVMVLAAERDMPIVDKLIDDLDQPIDATKEFEVFRLRYAVASQILAAIDSFFTGTGGGGQAQAPGGTTASRATSGGLRGRVRAISDSRTNSVIVQARPRDLEEVRRLIDELDQVGSSSVNQIKLIPLKNAVADEMAELLNLAIQSVISPPQQVRTQQGGGGFGGGGGGFGGAGGQGQVDQKLRDAKSAVLQLLDTEDGEQMLESGILSDIRINADMRTNSLVVTAPAESLTLIQALVRRFDQPASLVAEIKHFTLKNADAQSVTTLLNQLFNNQQQQGQGGRQGGGANQQNQQLGVNLAGAEDASSQLIPLRLSTDVRTNSIIAVGGGEALSVVEAIILRLDQDDVRQRKMTVYRLKNSPAANVATSITAFLQSQSDLATQANQGLVGNFEQFEREVIVVAEANSNSLLISATPRYYEDIMAIVEKIDMDQQQVVIQALLVEVELTSNDEFGVELGVQDSLLFNRGGSSVTNGLTSLVPGFNFNNAQTGGAPNANTTAFRPEQVGGQGLSNFSLNRSNSDLGYGGLVLSAGSESVSVLLRALSANRRLEILSRPQIRTLDNQLGRINVGRNVPVINGFTTNGALGQITPTVIRDDSGIILEVTPRITPDGRIVMQIGAERSDYDLQNGVTLTSGGVGGDIQAPVKNISRAVSTIAVADEQTIVLGGLIQKTDTTSERKVPWLGDVPVIGHAFRFDSHATKRTELLIFLTPRIIKNDSVNEMLKQVEAERMHYTECEAEALHGPLFAAPAPPSDGSVPPIYPPGGMWSNPNQRSLPLPPAPMPNSTNPNVPSVPPMSDDPQGDVKGAIYQETGSRGVSTSRVQQVGATKTSKAAKKPTILDTFRRKEAQR